MCNCACCGGWCGGKRKTGGGGLGYDAGVGRTGHGDDDGCVAVFLEFRLDGLDDEHRPAVEGDELVAVLQTC